MAEQYEPVVFEDSKGNEISNDPVWLAQKTLKAAGISTGGTRRKAADDDDEEVPGPYDHIKGKELADLARDRGITVRKGAKAGEVRAALEAQDDGNLSNTNHPPVAIGRDDAGTDNPGDGVNHPTPEEVAASNVDAEDEDDED